MAKVNERNLKCTDCGEVKAKGKNFYLSRSESYKSNDYRIGICKDCFLNMYMNYYNTYKDEYKAMYHLCMNYDIYFSRKVMDSSLSGTSGADGSVVGVYMKNINMSQYKNYTSLNSEHIILSEDSDEEVKKDEEYRLEQDENGKIKLTDDIRDKWGSEYNDEQCIALERYYKHYYNSYNHENDTGKLDILEEVCTYRLIKADAVRKNDTKTIREFTELISKRMADAGLKPSQQKISGEDDNDKFGMQCYIIETTDPIPKCLPEFEDVDRFWKYIVKHMIKPLSVAMGLAQGEYNLENGDGDIQLNEKMQQALEDSKNEG